MTPELKPCPFCGGEADYFSIYDTDYDPYRINYIRCKQCRAATANELRHPDDGRSRELIKAWNTRTVQEPTQGIDNEV